MRSSPRRPRFLLGAVVLALLGAVLAPVRAAAAPAAGNPLDALRRPAGVRDRARPAGLVPPARSGDLAVVLRHLATDPAHRIGSLLVNPGGPGDSGVDEVASRGARFDALTGGRFDIVGWDPRGSHRSTPVSCFASAADRAAFWGDVVVPTTRADEQRYLAKTVELAQRCGAAQRRTARPHLDGRPGARPRPPARAGRRPEADVLRRVQRHADGPDVREHVPRPGPGDGAGRHRRPGRRTGTAWRPRWRPG